MNRRSCAAELIRGTGPGFVSAQATTTQAALALKTSGLPMVPVCGPEEKLAGIVTSAALIAALAVDDARADRTVDEFMDPDPPFVADYASVEWVLVEMEDAGLWALPVVDAELRLLGIIALPDLTELVFPPLLAEIWKRATRSS